MDYCDECGFNLNYYHYALCSQHPSKCTECGWNTEVYHRNTGTYHDYNCSIEREENIQEYRFQQQFEPDFNDLLTNYQRNYQQEREIENEKIDVEVREVSKQSQIIEQQLIDNNQKNVDNERITENNPIESLPNQTIKSQNQEQINISNNELQQELTEIQQKLSNIDDQQQQERLEEEKRQEQQQDSDVNNYEQLQQQQQNISQKQLEAMEESNFIKKYSDFQYRDLKDYIVCDVETTGSVGGYKSRIYEIAARRVINGVQQEQYFHEKINPDRTYEQCNPYSISVCMSQEEFGEYGKISTKFSDIALKFKQYVGNLPILCHKVDVEYLHIRYEFENIGMEKEMIPDSQFFCTLRLAQRHFGRYLETTEQIFLYPLPQPDMSSKRDQAKCGVSSLCKYFHIDDSHRKLHGALIDVDLQIQVYQALYKRVKELNLVIDDHNQNKQEQLEHFPILLNPYQNVQTKYKVKVIQKKLKEQEKKRVKEVKEQKKKAEQEAKKQEKKKQKEAAKELEKKRKAEEKKRKNQQQQQNDSPQSLLEESKKIKKSSNKEECQFCNKSFARLKQHQKNCDKKKIHDLQQELKQQDQEK